MSTQDIIVIFNVLMISKFLMKMFRKYSIHLFVQVERVFREKKLVESELDKALRDQVTGGHETEQLFEKCIHAEQKLEQATSKIKALQQKIESIKAGFVQLQMCIQRQVEYSPSSGFYYPLTYFLVGAFWKKIHYYRGFFAFFEDRLSRPNSTRI